ncbi:MAG: discoidin domain-containing protein [Angelakisella sp.]
MFKYERPDIMLDNFHIDLSNPDATKFVKELYDEFLDGQDPVFQGDSFHIGTDEYNKEYSEIVRKYIDTMTTYIEGKGRQTRLWASLGKNGFDGTTPVNNNAIANFWSHDWAGFEEMLEEGYRFINNADNELYVVPGANYYHDFLDLERLFNEWNCSDFLYSKPDKKSYELKAGHPQLMGASAALWNDAMKGYSEFDIFERFRRQIMLMSEKGWYGEQTEGQTGAEFLDRIDAVDKFTPDANPRRYVATQGDVVAHFDFEEISNNVVTDLSANRYNAKVTNLTTVSGETGNALKLDGKGFMSLPFSSKGYPYTVSFDMLIDEETPADAIMFTGKDGTLFYNYKNTGKIGYERKGYAYLFDCEIPPNFLTNFVLTCSGDHAKLFVDTMDAGTGTYYKMDRPKALASSTFVLPVEKIASGIVGTLDNFKLYDRVLSDSEITGDAVDPVGGNLALNKDVTISSIEGGMNPDGSPTLYPQFKKENAVDGNTTTRVSFAQEDNSWLVVDLGKEFEVEKVSINFNERPNHYKVLVSRDAKQWEEISDKAGLEGGSTGVDTIELSTLKTARYIKYQQVEMFGQGDKFSGNFSEVEVYGYDYATHREIIAAAKNALDTVAETPENKALREKLMETMSLLESLIANNQSKGLSDISKNVKKQTEALLSGKILDGNIDMAALKELLDEKLDSSKYPVASWNEYQQALDYATRIYYDINATQAKVDYAVDRIIAAKDKLVLRDYITLSASWTFGTYTAMSNPEKLIIDGDINTSTWSEDNQRPGQFLQFEFREPLELSSVTLDCHTTDRSLLKGGNFQVSGDGKNWTTLGAMALDAENRVKTLTFKPVTAKFARFLITESAGWWEINEVIFNGGSISDLGVLQSEIDRVVDEERYTPNSFTAYAEALSQAKELVKNPDATQLEINNMVKALVAARNSLVKRANTATLELLISGVEDAENFTAESYAAYSEKIEAGKLVLENKNATRLEVDSIVGEIKTAKNNLIWKDYKHGLTVTIANANEILGNAVVGTEDGQYLQSSVDKLTLAIATAQGVLDDEKSDQKTYADAKAALDKAIEDFRNAVIVKPVDPDEGEDEDSEEEKVQSYSPTENDTNSTTTMNSFDELNEAIKEGKEIPSKLRTIEETVMGIKATLLPVKLSSGDALATSTFDTIASAGNNVGFVYRLHNGIINEIASMTVLGGFSNSVEQGRIYYPFKANSDADNNDDMIKKVSTEAANSDTFMLSTFMKLPTTVYVAAKTSIPNGETANIYIYNPETDKCTYVGTAKIVDGKVGFKTDVVGEFLVTTGKVG